MSRVHFIRIDLGETTTSESYLHAVEGAMRLHDWSCDYCIEQGLL